jgi:hypothetical protein
LFIFGAFSPALRGKTALSAKILQERALAGAFLQNSRSYRLRVLAAK